MIVSVKEELDPQVTYTSPLRTDKCFSRLPGVGSKVDTLLRKFYQVLHGPLDILFIARCTFDIDISRILPRTGTRNIPRTWSGFQFRDIDISQSKTGTDAMEGASLVLHDEGEGGFG